MIDDAQKYRIVRRILQVWNQKSGEYRENFSDLVVSKELGIPEIEIRTVRWESVGDTQGERTRRQSRENAALKIVQTLAENSTKISSEVEKILAECERNIDIWTSIQESSADLDDFARKLCELAECSPGEVLSQEGAAYRKILNCWNLSLDVDSGLNVRSSMAAICLAAGWEVPTAPKQHETP